MAFEPKDWKDAPSTSTPISATALEDLESRVAAYADSVAGGGGLSKAEAEAIANEIVEGEIKTLQTQTIFPIYQPEFAGGRVEGETPDSDAINAAIAKVNSLRGGTVYCSEGKYYLDKPLLATVPGTAIVGEGMPGDSDNHAKGSTQMIVGDGIWGLTVGEESKADFRGYRVEGLHFYEKNAGKGLGGLRILSTSNGSYTRVSAGQFTKGTGILNAGKEAAIQCQYNTFTDCRVGRCLIGYEQVHANGTRWIGGYGEGTAGSTTLTGSTGFKLTSGDTFRSLGLVVQGYDVNVDLGPNRGHELLGTRYERWTTASIIVRSGCIKPVLTGHGDNSLASNSGTGIIIEAGAEDVEMGVNFENVKTLGTNNGTRTRYPGRSGLAKGAAVVGSVVGQFPQYDSSGNIVGYAPLYDSATGIYLVQNLGGTIKNETGATTVVRTLTAPVNVGDMVVVAGGYGSGSTQTITVTDSRSNTWTVHRHDDMLTGATPHSFVASSPLTTALQIGDTITVTFGAAVNYPAIFCYDYAGQIAGTVLDVAGGATGTSTEPSTGEITTTTDYPLLLSAVYYDQAAATFTPGSGFTNLDRTSSASKTLNVETKNGPAASKFVGASATLSSSVAWAQTVVAFKKVASTAPALDSRVVVGPSSAVDSNIAVFDKTTGKLLKDGGKTIAELGGASLTSSSKYITADVTMAENGKFYDGPSLTLAKGTYLLVGAVQLLASSKAARRWEAKLWDGTTKVTEGSFAVDGTAETGQSPIPLVGVVSPSEEKTYKISALTTVANDTIKGTSNVGSYLHAVKIA